MPTSAPALPNMESPSARCSGRPPDWAPCPNAPTHTVLLHGRVLTGSCLTCLSPVVDEILAMGHGSCRTEKWDPSRVPPSDPPVIGKGPFWSSAKETMWRRR